MKRFVCIAVILLLVAGGCKWLEGDKGDPGLTGSSGQDAVISTNSYEFNPSGNPYNKSIPEINLAWFKSGKQTVDSYAQYSSGEWIELPQFEEYNGKLYKDEATVDHQVVIFLTYEDGAVASGNAINGVPCMVIVKTFNK